MAINIDAATRKFLDAVAAAGGPPIYTLTPNAARKVLSGAEAGPINTPAADAEERTIPVGPKGSIRIVVIRPDDVRDRVPVMMYFHGAGWVFGGFDMHQRLVREIAHGAHVAIVFVDYGRSPERYGGPLAGDHS